MAERPAPLVLVAAPSQDPPFGSYAAVSAAGQELLAAELSQRFGRLGAAVAPLRAERAEAFHWGAWFVASASAALAADGAADAIGYAGAGSLALLADAHLDDLLSPLAGEVVANNRFSADAFVVAGDLELALRALEGCSSDNGAARCLESAGFKVRDLAAAPFSRFDVDTPLDLAILRLATRLPQSRPLAPGVARFLEMALLPGGRSLEVPGMAEIGAIMRDRGAELVVSGRVPADAWQYLERETACRVRCFIEERGMRSARSARPRSLLAVLLARSSPAELVGELSRLGDAVVLDSRVLMAARAGSAEASAWPPEEDRFAADFGDASRIGTDWLRELVEAAAAAPVPWLTGGHALVSDGLRLLVDAAWQGH
ncbi:MAG: hypothetical protein M3R05_02590 [Chloroflexota bacterium]|nr:hypothetical protein [Chloroflexota bacterium]